jgi:hypothetical protein
MVGMSVQLHRSWPRHQMEVCGRLHAAIALALALLDKRVGGPHSRSGHCVAKQSILSTSGMEAGPSSLQPAFCTAAKCRNTGQASHATYLCTAVHAITEIDCLWSGIGNWFHQAKRTSQIAGAGVGSDSYTIRPSEHHRPRVLGSGVTVTFFAQYFEMLGKTT